ncbi:MAG: RNA polymerase sigma factor [Phycisphaerales bacterium]
MALQATNAAEADRAPGVGALSREVFASLFEEHSRLFWCIAAGVLGDRSRASDVVQEAAVVGLTRISQFEAGTSFQAWMGQIVRFVALNEARKMKPQSAEDGVLGAIAGRAQAAASSPVDRLSGQLRAGQEAFDDDVARALRGLDETARACLLMKTVLDLPYARIGEALGIPEGTAMSHVHRSRAAMRASLAGVSVQRGGAR